MRKKRKCDLVSVRGDRLWELGDCMGEFLGKKRTIVCCEGKRPGFIYCNKVCLGICTRNYERNGIGNLKILRFVKSRPFSSRRNWKIKNFAVVGAFPSHGISPGEDGGCFLRCSKFLSGCGFVQNISPLSLSRDRRIKMEQIKTSSLSWKIQSVCSIFFYFDKNSWL